MSRAPLNDLSGTVLAGRYELRQLLGRGGMGAVYLATQRGLGRKVAVKVLLPELASDGEVLARFQREAQLAASLGHPNIVQVTDFGHEPGEPAFLAMEVLEGETLRERVTKQGPLEPAACVRIGVQVLSALDAAHRAGVLHRDLKPDNIFLLEMPGVGTIVKLIDFGIARLTESEGYRRLTATGMLVGTPLYMAPEQLTGGALDGRSDLYALGVTLFRALTGRAPFSGNVEELLRAKVQGPVPRVRDLRPAVPDALAALLEQTLAVDPAQRPSSAHAMREAMLALKLEPSPMPPGPAPRPSAPSVAAPRTLPRWPLALGGGVLVALLALAVGLVFVRPWLASRGDEDGAPAAPAPAASASAAVAVTPQPGAPAEGMNLMANLTALAFGATPSGGPQTEHWSATVLAASASGDVSNEQLRLAQPRIVQSLLQCLEASGQGVLQGANIQVDFHGTAPEPTLAPGGGLRPLETPQCRPAFLSTFGGLYRPTAGEASFGIAQLSVLVAPRSPPSH